ncbi:MAG: hypothetical protein NTV70_07035 [Acidobacteria bacterium]|nr:hypothetical protein [Acidobacteriota bacterium]
MALTRRAFLLAMPAMAATPRGQLLPTDRARFADGATEMEVLRMTDPAYSSFLPAPWLRSASSRSGFLIYSSDRPGSMQALRMDIKTGESKVLTEAANLNPRSVTLAADEKSIYYLDGTTLKQTSFAMLRDREVATEVGPFSVSEDGLFAAYCSGGKLMLATLAVKGTAKALAEVSADAAIPLIRPKRAGVLCRDGESTWLATFEGGAARKLKTGPVTSNPQWSADGRAFTYLSGSELREHTPDSNADALVAKTSQFITFGRNADASVFVGASGSKASPYVLLMLRVTRRELALCEHRCSHPDQVNPTFSPSSQRIYFQSDRNGKMAIYSMTVEKLVEKTETD